MECWKTDDERRYNGQFYTRSSTADLGLEYAARALGQYWYKNHWIWDCCAGLGALTLGLEDTSNVWLSTLDSHEVDYLKTAGVYNPEQVWQQDFVNTGVYNLNPVPWRLQQLIKSGAPGVVIMNPPYASASGQGLKGVSKTVAKYKYGGILGKAQQELASGFIARAAELKPVSILLYFKPKLLQSPNYETLRHNLGYGLDSGFVVPGRAFHGVTAPWPVAFMVLKPGDNWTRVLDVYQIEDHKLVQRGRKLFGPLSGRNINAWCKAGLETKPRVETRPPVKSGVSLAERNIRCDKMAKSALGYINSAGSAVQNSAQSVALFSSPFSSGNGWSVTPENFWQTCACFAVRKAIKPTWLNDRDQFSEPQGSQDTWYTDCLVYMLFHPSNQTSELHNVEYKGRTYCIENQWFPYASQAFEHLAPGLGHPSDDTVVHQILCDYRLSPKALELWLQGSLVYKLWFENHASLDHRKWRLDGCRPGWYQVRKSLEDLGLAGPELKAVSDLREDLRQIIEPRVYSLGYLRRPYECC